MGFLIYLILMPIIYCLITFPAHFEGISWNVECEKVGFHCTLWTVLKLIVYYGIEISYCLIIKGYLDVLPWIKSDYNLGFCNGFFVFCSLAFIAVHCFGGYFGAFDELEGIPPFIHIFLLGLCFAMFSIVICTNCEDLKFSQLPYETSVETRNLHTLGDSFVLSADIHSRYRYVDIHFEEGYQISYSYLVDGKLYIDSFPYSKDKVVIQEANDENAYLEIVKHFKNVEFDGGNKYDEYYTYNLYLPKGIFDEQNQDVNLDFN